MPPDPSVQIALFALVGSIATGVVSIFSLALTFWNQQRLFRNQRVLAHEERKWDQEDRALRHQQTLKAVDVVAVKADDAYNEANHTKEQIIKLHEENKEIHQEIKAVLKVAESVKQDTGQHDANRAQRP